MIRLLVLTLLSASSLMPPSAHAMGSKMKDHLGWLKDRSNYLTFLGTPVVYHRPSGMLPSSLETRMQKIEVDNSPFEILETRVTPAELNELVARYSLPPVEQKTTVTRVLPNSGWFCDYVKAISTQKYRLHLSEKAWLADRSLWFRISYLFGGGRPESVAEILQNSAITLNENGPLTNVTELVREHRYGMHECDDWRSDIQMANLHSKFNLASHILKRSPYDSRSIFMTQEVREADSKITASWKDIDVDPYSLTVLETPKGWNIDFEVTDMREYVDRHGYSSDLKIEKTFDELQNLTSVNIGKSIRIYANGGEWKVQWLAAETYILPPKKNETPQPLALAAFYDLQTQRLDDGHLVPTLSPQRHDRALPVIWKRSRIERADSDGVVFMRVTGWMNYGDRRTDCSEASDRDGFCGRVLALKKNDPTQLSLQFLWSPWVKPESLNVPLVYEVPGDFARPDFVTYSSKQKTIDGDLESKLYSVDDPAKSQRWVMDVSWVGSGWFGSKSIKDTQLFLERIN